MDRDFMVDLDTTDDWQEANIYDPQTDKILQKDREKYWSWDPFYIRLVSMIIVVILLLIAWIYLAGFWLTPQQTGWREGMTIYHYVSLAFIIWLDYILERPTLSQELSKVTNFNRLLIYATVWFITDLGPYLWTSDNHKS